MVKHIAKRTKLHNKAVLVRLDLNVPLGENKKVDAFEDWRIQSSLKTIQYLKKHKARTIIISHIGRDPKESLKPVSDYLQKKIKHTFIPEVLSERVTQAVEDMKPGEVVMLENLRSDEGEIANKASFARGLSRLAEIYVNDAFAVCHRRHASIVGIPKHIPSYAGFQLHEEITHLHKLVDKPKRPFTFILGGAKFETKLPLIKKFLDHADTVFVGGALMNDFFKVQSLDVGKSVVSEKRFNIRGLLKKESLIVPHDVLVERDGKVVSCATREIQKKDVVVDIGPESQQTLVDAIADSKLVLWNGPLGWYEKGHKEGSKACAQAMSKTKGTTVVGGGDSVALVREIKQEKNIDFISTGGGAMLELLEKGTLPGIKALE